MTRLKDLIDRNDFNLIFEKIKENYPESKKDCYVTAWGFLKEIKEKESDDFLIKIEHIKDDDEEFYMVSGMCKNDKMHYSMMLYEWCEWLGMEIEKGTLEKYSEKEALAHIIWEMTFVGYDPETIKTEKEYINEMKNQIENGELKTVPLEDLID